MQSGMTAVSTEYNRFLNRFWNLVMDSKDKNIKATKEMIKARHKTDPHDHNPSGELQPEYGYFRISWSTTTT